jgi:hypothetical protein
MNGKRDGKSEQCGCEWREKKEFHRMREMEEENEREDGQEFEGKESKSRS